MEEIANVRNVAEVRKVLQAMRDGVSQHTPDTPICLSDRLFNGMTHGEFSFEWVFVHHWQRHKKSASSRSSSGSKASQSKAKGAKTGAAAQRHNGVAHPPKASAAARADTAA